MNTDKYPTQTEIDELNDELRAQVEREMPTPAGGFADYAEEQAHQERHEARFMELVKEVAR